jgi:Fe-S-cluster formation regulator IscX/YfhJ
MASSIINKAEDKDPYDVVFLVFQKYSLEQKITKINDIINVMNGSEEKILQDIIALWSAIEHPTDKYCNDIMKMILVLINTLHKNDSQKYTTIAQNIQEKINILHQKEARENEEYDVDTILNNI